MQLFTIWSELNTALIARSCIGLNSESVPMISSKALWTLSGLAPVLGGVAANAFVVALRFLGVVAEPVFVLLSPWASKKRAFRSLRAAIGSKYISV